MIDHSNGMFKDANNNDIFHQAWLPQGEIKAVILLAHGLSEHSGRYGYLIDSLVPLGYAVYSWDHLGHGRSDGPRKYIDAFTDFTDVMSQYVAQIKEQHPESPVFLLGHSMGGLISVNYLLDHQHDFSGLILSAPAIKPAGGVSPITKIGGKILSALVPTFGFKSINGKDVCREPEVLESIVNDPLFGHGKITIRLLAEILNGMERVEAEAESITLPIIILQGTEDRIVDPAGAEFLYELVSSEDKTLKVYDGFYHELFNDPEKALVFADVKEWLEAQLVK